MSDEFDLTVLEFIRESGSTATLLKQTTGAYDPAAGTASTTSEDIAVEGILMDLTLQSNGLSTKYGTLVQAGDKEFYMRPAHKTNPLLSQVEIVPASDRLRIGTTVYKIVTFKELNPTGSDQILITLYLRR